MAVPLSGTPAHLAAPLAIIFPFGAEGKVPRASDPEPNQDPQLCVTHLADNDLRS